MDYEIAVGENATQMFLGLLAALLLSPNIAFAFCSEPNAPDAPSTFSRPDKPTIPFCVNTLDNTHTCEDWEIDSYNRDLRNYRDEVNDYVQDLRDYIDEAEDYYSEVVAYTKCEVNDIE